MNPANLLRSIQIDRKSFSARWARAWLSFALVVLCAASVSAQGDAAKPKASSPAAKPSPSPTKSISSSTQRIVREGIAVEFQVEPLRRAGTEKTEVMEAEDASVRFSVTDTATKTPVTGLNLSAWMSLRQDEQATDANRCREKVQSYLQGSLRARPEVDLNSYYLLALNKEPNISVIDPLIGFGGSKLLTLVMLKSPGQDWVLSSDRKRLFVAMPFVNQVAVVDTEAWKVVANVDTGARPTRVSLQPDEKYLWVGYEGLTEAETSGASVIDALELKKVADIPTGAGRHELAFTADSRYAFVTNRKDATLSVVDVRKLSKLKDVKTGASPASIALSSLSKALYLASDADGSITVVDSNSHQVVARMQGKTGLRAVRFAPGGRYGFALSPQENTVHIFDASTNRMLHSLTVGKQPDQVAFTSTFAYIRSAASEQVEMIRLTTIGQEPDVKQFPGGQLAPGRVADSTLPDTITPAPEGNSVLVANPADKMIYYYTEGMAAPMGNFQNYRREPRSVMVVDRSLRESAPGVYTTTLRLPKSGLYDVAFLSDSPRILHCFEASAAPNPSIKRAAPLALAIEYQMPEKQMRTGKEFLIRFKLTDTATGQPKEGLKDVRVLTFLAPGIWQNRTFAQSAGKGIYEVRVTPPQSGVYMIFVESASQGVSYRQLPHLTLQATDAATSTTTTKTTSEASAQPAGNNKPRR
ncbi:MAG TPA: cytochrome D1 domain-containing protein [Pyrinomonadaceae bacterium]|jgi:YVTN family beta-propeller protein